MEGIKTKNLNGSFVNLLRAKFRDLYLQHSKVSIRNYTIFIFFIIINYTFVLTQNLKFVNNGTIHNENLYEFIKKIINQSVSTEIIILESVGLLLSLGVLPYIANYEFHHKKSKTFFAYWYITILFALCTFSTYMALTTENHFTFYFNTYVSYIILIILVDWLSFLILSYFGFLLGLLLVWLTHGKNYILNEDISYNYWVPLFYSILSFMTVFLWRRYNSQNIHKITDKKIFNSAIAHEVLSPLLAIESTAILLQEIINHIKLNNVLAKKHGQIQILMLQDDYETIKNLIPQQIERLSQEAKDIVEILLMLVEETSVTKYKSTHKISNVIDEVIKSYGNTLFKKHQINILIEDDFTFYGSKQLIKHILLNFLSNTKKHVSVNAAIEIRVNNNTIYYRDNGHKPNKKEFEKSFELFSTTNEFGYGIGLAFCNAVIKLFGGHLTFVYDKEHKGHREKGTGEFKVQLWNKSIA